MRVEGAGLEIGAMGVQDIGFTCTTTRMGNRIQKHSVYRLLSLAGILRLFIEVLGYQFSLYEKNEANDPVCLPLDAVVLRVCFNKTVVEYDCENGPSIRPLK